MDQSTLTALLPQLPPPMVLAETDSTNRILKELAAAGAPAGTAVLADYQTDGRGRLGRSFHSPEGGIYLSVLLRPALPPEQLALVTPMAAVAVCAATEALCGISPGIKWVNDLWLNGRKLCGILTERAGGGAVVGIGLNYRQPAEGFPPPLSDTVTALYPPTGGAVSMEALAADILTRLTALSDALPDFSFLDAYRRRSLLPGKAVTVYPVTGEPFPAAAESIDDQARLVVRTKDGQRLALSSGEVSVRPLVTE